MEVAEGSVEVAMGYKSSPNVDNDDKVQFQAAIGSLVVGVVLLAAKFWAYEVTGSNAVFSDAMESIVNVVAALLLIFVVRYAARPADEDHPYGHGKIEHFSAAFEGGLITFAAIAIVFDGFNSLIKGHSVAELNTGLIVVAGAGLVNFALGFYLNKVGEKQDSQALKASGKHIMSDFWTSVGILVGLALVKFTGHMWLDSVVAIIVGGLLGRSGWGIIRSSIGGLMDEESDEDLQKLADCFSNHASQCVIQIHHVKMIRSGRFHHVDAHLVVPEYWNVKDVHDNIDRFEYEVSKDYSHNLELHFHLDPCRQAYCIVCDVKNCPIRKEDFVQRRTISLEEFKSMDEPVQFRD